ncbi:hypothetical protein GCM10022255_005900 [Dactylosporangium darangshiense]|uniref:DUF4173 domain-containing protein n=2 Tax=Dactylosporangium darangshiense TaxID=579108 RepID=A0ABP8CW88_9ACTN
MPNPAVISPIQLGPPAPTVWQRAWPRREAAAGRAALYGALIAALAGAAAVPLDRPGIGWPIAGIGMLVPLVMLLARRRTGKSIEAFIWCAGALALLSVGFFRAAGWLFVLCALTAFGCVSLAVGLHRRVPAVLTAPFTLLFAAFRAMPWAQAGLATDRRPASAAAPPVAAPGPAAADGPGGAAADNPARAAADGPARAAVSGPGSAASDSSGRAAADGPARAAVSGPGSAASDSSGRAAVDGPGMAAADRSGKLAIATGPAAQPGARQAEAGASNSMRLLASIGIGVALLLVFGALFSSADAAFGRVISAIVPSLDVGTVARWVFVGVVAGGISLGAAFLVANPSTVGEGEPRTARPVRRVEWLVPVGALLVMFVLFVAVQLAVLFGDRDYVMRTVGLTFAEYARKGFWQLLVITLLTLCVMGVTARKAPRGSGTDRWLLWIVLGALAACSLVVVGSALWRMDVYEQAYGFTRLRVFVSAFELWLGGLFVLVMAAGLGGLRRRTSWLGRAAVGLWVVTLLGLAVLNPDRFIAAHNVDRVGASNSDIWYLRNLSADAAPELDRLPEGARECALSEIAGDLARDEDDWRGWNLGRSRARQIVPERIEVHNYPCYRRY